MTINAQPRTKLLRIGSRRERSEPAHSGLFATWPMNDLVAQWLTAMVEIVGF
jgi:hypothetical protein